MKSFDLFDPITLEGIRRFSDIANKLGIPFILVGAAARDFLLEHEHGIETGRLTKDIDIAIFLNNWNEYHSLQDQLIALDDFSTTRFHNKLKFQNILEIDFIPFGEVEDANGKVALPPDSSFIMDISGFQDVFEASSVVELKDKLKIRIVSLPGLVILKIFAWNDRKNESDKDAIDLRLIIETYLDAGNNERIFIEYPEIVTDDFDYNKAGTWLLGKDIQTIASAQTKDKLLNLLKGQTVDGISELAASIAGTNARVEDSYTFYKYLIDNLISGIEDSSPIY